MRYTFTPAERITKAKIKLQKDAPFFAYLVMNMQITEDKTIPSMGVNFKGNARYNPEWIDTLSDDEIKGVLSHEVMHTALLHLLRVGKKEHQLWNIATDMAINWLLIHDGLVLPEQGIIPDHYGDVKLPQIDHTFNVKDKCADELYEELLDKIPPCKCNCHGKTNSKGSGNNKGQGSNSQGQQGNCCGCGDQGFDQHEYAEGLSDAEREEISKEWKNKLVEAATAAKAKGRLPGGIERLVDDLLNPKLNWKSLLYQYLTKDLLYNHTYRKPGRRTYSVTDAKGNPIFFPSEIKENLNIAVTVDTSGSISIQEYKDFVTEVYGIATAFEQINMDLIFWDTEVQKVVQITRNNKENIINLEPTGGGGTHIGCLMNHYRGKQPPQLMVHLTDGYIESRPELPWSKHMFVLSKQFSTDDIVKDYGIVTSL